MLIAANSEIAFSVGYLFVLVLVSSIPAWIYRKKKPQAPYWHGNIIGIGIFVLLIIGIAANHH